MTRDAQMGRVLDEQRLAAEVQRRQAAGACVVVTNGVFNLLPVGHLRYLRAARALGDVLVVGINSDASANRLKPGRPLVPEAERAELVAALEPVDYATVFADPTADRLIARLRPAVYAKGGDYSEASLPEAATARAVGGTDRARPPGTQPLHDRDAAAARRRAGHPVSQPP